MNRARIIRGYFGDPTGSLATGTRTYASSIDAAITNLKAEYCYDPGLFGMPLLVLMHGYAEDMSALTASTRGRFASRGFFVLVPGMRGRNGAAGVRDASGRETHDIVDGVLDVLADPVIGARIDPWRIDIAGYSGGAGNALAAIAKCPDLWNHATAHFGPSDYGFHPTLAWYFTNPAFQASLTADVGASPSAQPGLWKTRDHVTALALQLELARRARGDASPLLTLYHDADDSAVSVLQSDRLVAELAAANLSGQVEYHRSTAASVTRYLHGYPDTSPGVLAAEEDWWRRAMDAPPWFAPENGRALVAGWLRLRRLGVSVWLGLTTAAGGSNPKTDASGGKVHVADLRYVMDSGSSGSFTVAPLTGPMRVRIEVGSSVVTQEISSTTTIAVAA